MSSCIIVLISLCPHAGTSYYLFMETFAALDKDNIGFLKAGELDRVLCGMRDLVSNDRKSIIDVEDEDMLINYEQFAKMLLGADTY